MNDSLGLIVSWLIANCQPGGNEGLEVRLFTNRTEFLVIKLDLTCTPLENLTIPLLNYPHPLCGAVINNRKFHMVVHTSRYQLTLYNLALLIGAATEPVEDPNIRAIEL